MPVRSALSRQQARRPQLLEAIVQRSWRDTPHVDSAHIWPHPWPWTGWSGSQRERDDQGPVLESASTRRGLTRGRTPATWCPRLKERETLGKDGVLW